MLVLLFAPQTEKVMAMVHDKCLVKKEKVGGLLLQCIVILFYFIISLVVNLLLCLIYKLSLSQVCMYKKKHGTCRFQHYPRIHASTEDLGKYLLWIRG